MMQKAETTIILSNVNNGWVATIVEREDIQTFIAADLQSALTMVGDVFKPKHEVKI